MPPDPFSGSLLTRPHGEWRAEAEVWSVIFGQPAQAEEITRSSGFERATTGRSRL